MLVKLAELKGPEVFLEIEDKKYQLMPFNLGVESWCYTEFASEEEPDGLANMNKRLANNDVKAALMVAYGMLIDKADFPTFEDFFKKIQGIQGGFEIIQLAVIKAIRQALPQTVADPAEVKKKIWKALALVELIGLIYMIFLHQGTLTP